MKRIRGAIVGLLLLAAPASAQWAKQRDPSLPRTLDGQANLAGPAPRSPDGKPDLSGIWLPDADPAGKPGGIENVVFPRYFVNIAEDLSPAEQHFQPSASTLFKERLQSQGTIDPIAHCKPWCAFDE